MKNLRINHEDVFDLLQTGLINNIEELYDLINAIIKDGYKVSFYSSYLLTDDNPLVTFEKSDDFQKWRIEALANRKKTIEFIENYITQSHNNNGTK
jgi:hypothetical protein